MKSKETKRLDSHLRYTPLTGRRANALNSASTLVEGSQTGTKIGRVAGIGGHFGKTTGNLTKSLGPARRGVSHHADVVAHVTEVLGKGDAWRMSHENKM